jgi:hypothetical protein
MDDQRWWQREILEAKLRWIARQPPFDLIRNDRTGKIHLAFSDEDRTLCGITDIFGRTQHEGGMTKTYQVSFGNAEVQATCQICRRNIPGGPPCCGSDAEFEQLKEWMRIRRGNKQRKGQQRTEDPA